MNKTVNTSVVVIQESLPEYRVPFFNALEDLLSARGYRLTVLAGCPPKGHAYTDAIASVPCAERIRNFRLTRRIYAQLGVKTHIRQAAMIIVPQSISYLNIYPLILFRHRQPDRRIAMWGHGDNLQKQSSEAIKSHLRTEMSRRVDWWFAYTRSSARIVEARGFDPNRVTVVHNSIDTVALTAAVKKLRSEALAKVRAALFSDSLEDTRAGWTPTAVFCGRLVEIKAVDLLLHSLVIIRRSLPGFRAIVVGDGPRKKSVERFCARNRWCLWVGAQHGLARAKYLALSDVFLSPGALGLAVLDAFAAGIPVIGTTNGMNGPEVDYLEPGRTGILCSPNAVDFAGTVSELLQDHARLATMKSAAAMAAGRYSLENMAKRFTDGICTCLNYRFF